MRGTHNNHPPPKPRYPSGGNTREAKKPSEDFPELGKKGEAVNKKDVGKAETEKDADVIVVDASVLVHAIGQVKKWCKDGRKEIVIVPLEGACIATQRLILSNDPQLVIQS